MFTATEPDHEATAEQLERAAVTRQIQQRLVEHMLEQKQALLPEHQEAFDEIIRRRMLMPGHLQGGRGFGGPRRGRPGYRSRGGPPCSNGPSIPETEKTTGDNGI